MSGGVNIYPQKIEDCLNPPPGVEDDAVRRVSRRGDGELVAALIVPTEGAGPDGRMAEVIPGYVSDPVTGCKDPCRVEFVSSLP